MAHSVPSVTAHCLGLKELLVVTQTHYQHIKFIYLFILNLQTYTIFRHTQQVGQGLSRLNKSIATVIKRCVKPDPCQRYKYNYYNKEIALKHLQITHQKTLKQKLIQIIKKKHPQQNTVTTGGRDNNYNSCQYVCFTNFPLQCRFITKCRFVKNNLHFQQLSDVTEIV